MKDGYLKTVDKEHLYIIDSLRKPIICITKLIQNLKLSTLTNGLNEMSFDMVYDEKYKDIYDLLFEKWRLYIRLDGYGEFVVDDPVEDNEGNYKIVSVKLKDSHYMFDKRNFSLVNTSAEYYSAPLVAFNEDGTVSTTQENLMAKLFNPKNGGMISWSTNKSLIDETIDFREKSFQGITQFNLYKFIYENMERSFDIIPFFNSLDRTIAFKKTENSIDDTGIVVTFDTFINSLVRECSNDTFCTKLFTSGNNLDVRRVNPYGDNYIYDYSGIYHLCTPTLKQHLEDFKATYLAHEAEYKVKFADYSENKVQYELYYAQFESLSPMHMKLNQALAYADINYGENSPEAIEARKAYWDWIYEVGFDTITANRDNYETLYQAKEVELDSIADICKRDNFLTHDDMIELDQFEIEATYKQDAFAYIKGMNEAQKGDISQMLQQYARLEITRYNQPRFNFTIKLSNFCHIVGCEYFADQLNVGKYIRLMDKQGNMYKVIIVRIDYDKENPQDIELTLSDKLSGHEYFPTLNEYINNAVKAMQDIQEANIRMDEIDSRIDSVSTSVNVVDGKVEQLYSFVNQPSNISVATRAIAGKVMIPDENFDIDANGALSLADNLSLGTPIEGTEKRGTSELIQTDGGYTYKSYNTNNDSFGGWRINNGRFEVYNPLTDTWESISASIGGYGSVVFHTDSAWNNSMAVGTNALHMGVSSTGTDSGKGTSIRSLTGWQMAEVVTRELPDVNIAEYLYYYGDYKGFNWLVRVSENAIWTTDNGIVSTVTSNKIGFTYISMRQLFSFTGNARILINVDVLEVATNSYPCIAEVFSTIDWVSSTTQIYATARLDTSTTIGNYTLTMTVSNVSGYINVYFPRRDVSGSGESKTKLNYIKVEYY